MKEILIPLGLLVFARLAGAQSISVNGSNITSYTITSGFATVCQGDNVTLSVSMLSTCNVAHTYAWSKNGTALGITTPTLNLNPFTLSDAGVYSVVVSCSDPVGSQTASVTLGFAPNPGPAIVQAPTICEPATTSILTFGSPAIFSGSCATCNTSPSSNFEWTLTHSSHTFNATGSNFSTDYTTLLASLLDLGSATSINVGLRVTDIYGCRWNASPTTASVVREPFGGLAVVPDPMTIGSTSSPVNLVPLTTPAGSGAAALSNGYTLSASLGGTPAGVVSGTNYHIIAPGSETLTITAQKGACVYSVTDSFQVVPSVAISFTNQTTGSATVNWEACAGDLVQFGYTGAALNTATHVRLARKGGGYVVVELESCPGLTACTPTAATPPGTLTANHSFETNKGLISTAAPQAIRLSIPLNAVTGAVEFFGYNPADASATPASALAVISNPGILTVHNPEVGFAVIKNPVCYSDKVPILGIPSGGAFTAREASMDLTVPGAPAPIPPFVSAPNIVVDTGSIPILDASKVVTLPASNDGGQMVELRYEYTPKYTNGSNCPVSIISTDTIPVYDNRGVSFSFPLATYDPAGTNINLNTQISNIIPAPNGGTATQPPAPSSWINTPGGFDFWGTFVQFNSGAGNYDFLMPLAGVGTHTVNLEMDNNGCKIESSGQLNILPSPEFVNLPPAMCRIPTAVNFKRDPNYNRQTGIDTTKSCFFNVVIITPPIFSLRDMELDSSLLQTHQPVALNDKDGNPVGVSNWHISDQAEHLFAGAGEAMQLRALGLTCRPVSLIYKDHYQYSRMEVWGSPAPFTGTPLARLDNVGAAVIGSGVLATNPSNLNHPLNESFDFASSSALLTGYSSVYMVMTLRSVDNICPIIDDQTTPYTTGPCVANQREIQIVQEVQLFNASNVSIDSLPPVFCYNSPQLFVQSTPVYDPGFSMFTVQRLTPTLGPVDTLVENLLDVPALFGASTVNAVYRLTYKYTKYFGCDSITTRDFTVIAPQPVSFVGASIGASNTICSNSVEELFVASPPPSFGQGGTFSGPGIGFTNQNLPSVNNMFSPVVAGLGNKNITYTFTDLYGCVSTNTRTITVRSTPNVNLTTASGAVSFCSDVASVSLLGTPDTSVVPGTSVYFGPTIALNSNVFQPQLLYATDSAVAIGGVSVYYSYTDTFGCTGTDTLRLSVQPLPVPQIGGIGNRYCGNASLVTTLTGSDATGVSSSSISFFGDGVVPGTNTYSPVLAGAGLDTLYLAIQNVYGCRDTTFKIITIDTVPVPVIANVDVDYCVNETPFILQANLNPQFLPGTTGVFSGVGITVNGQNYTFSPQLAASQAGLGNHIITYTFTDGNGCVGVDRDTTIIRALPTADFALAPSYCVDAPDQFLAPTIVGGPFSSVSFNGPGIVDSVQGQLNFATAALPPGGFGLQQINFVYADTFGCGNITTKVYLLNNLPTANIAGLSPGYCTNNNPVALQGFPSATVGGPGVPTSNFIHDIPTGFAITNATNAQAGIIPADVPPGAYTVRYAYTDANGCKDTAVTTVEFFAPPVPNITNLAPSYCETQDTFFLTATPGGGEYSGPGIVQGTNFFMPYRSGPGTHLVNYTVTQSNNLTLSVGTVACTAFDTDTTTVYALPIPSITNPANNAQFCVNNPPVNIVATITNPSTLVDSFSVYHGNGVDYLLVPTVIFLPPFGNVTINDTVYRFNPGLAGPGSHVVTFIATNIYGCVDSVKNTYVVHPMPQPAFAVPSTFCESDPGYPLAGSPSPGTFIRNGVTMASSVYVPNPNYPTMLLNATQYDTLVYTVSNALCTNSDTQFVTVNPVPRPSYVSLNGADTTYKACIGMDTLSLIPNIPGGVFGGGGVLFGTNIFLPGLSGVGEHLVSYHYTDPATGCSNSYSDTFFVYNTPKVRLSSDGNCGDAQIVFHVDTTQLNVFGMFMGNLYDQLTTVRWNVGDGTIRNEAALPGNIIDTIHHYYSAPGAYFVSLYVENNNYCSGTDTLRIIVSPAVTPTAAAPYFENFEAGNGGWFDEKEGSDAPSGFWNWTIATGTRINTVNNPHQNVWVTHGSQPYGQDESGWVYGPCVNLTQLNRPMLSLDYFSDMDMGNDGVVIEYFNENQQKWLPLGAVNRGINWYNRDVIAGRPGLQDLAPIGWSGEMGVWKTGRIKLDEFRNYTKFRFRVAFGAVGVQNRGLQGFAFDDVWIGNRTRNVLLEHFSNASQPGMSTINNHVYNLIYNTPVVRDVHLVQYHLDNPGYDDFNQDNKTDPAARELYYGVSGPGKAIIDGKNYGAASALSAQLQERDFEYEMLETPKFDISINNFMVFGNTVNASSTLTAMQAMPQQEYTLQLAVVEDSLVHQSTQLPMQTMATLRGMIPSAAGTTYNQAWSVGQQQSVNYNWTIPFQGFNAGRFELVVFVQNYLTKEVYQVASTRDLTVFPGYTGIEEVEEEVLQEAAQVSDFKLYPNPARDHFTVEFEQPLPGDYDWHLVDLRGVRLRSGKAPALITQLSVDGLQDLPTGVYLFVLQGNKFFTQRKVVIGN